MSGCTAGESAGGGRALEAQGLVCARGTVVNVRDKVARHYDGDGCEAAQIDGEPPGVAGVSASTNEASTPRSVDGIAGESGQMIRAVADGGYIGECCREVGRG